MTGIIVIGIIILTIVIGVALVASVKSLQIGKEYYDSIPSEGKELEEFIAIGGTFILPAVNQRTCTMRLRKFTASCRRMSQDIWLFR